MNVNVDTFSIREVYDYVQVELNRAKAPSVTLEDFLYFLNKAINNYCNIKYNTFNLNQQFTDDLRELIRTYTVSSPKIKDGNNVIMQNNVDPLTPITPISGTDAGINIDYAVVSTELPGDYYHLIGCTIKYKRTAKPITSKRYEIYTIRTKIPYKVRRVTTDSLTMTLNNYYYRPKPNNPYFILNNEAYGSETKTVNPSVEIHIGKLPETHTVEKVSMTYFINPKKVEMTEDDLYSVEDTTEKMEFSRYICYEIINILIGLIMINTGNPLVGAVQSFNKTIQPINIPDIQIPPLADVDPSTQDTTTA